MITRHDEVDYRHPRTAFVLVLVSWSAWIVGASVVIGIAFGHLPTALAGPILTAFAIITLVLGGLGWHSADREIRDCGATCCGPACSVA